MRSRMILFLVTLLALSLGLPMSAYADPGDDANVTVTIDDIVWLNIHGEPIGWNVSGYYGNLWFEWGHTSTKGVVCQVKANCDWRVDVMGVEDYFTNTGDGSWDKKPREDIMWKDDIPDFIPLPDEWTQVGIGEPGVYLTNEDGAPNSSFYVLLDYADDKPGTYSYTVSFQIYAT